METERIGRKGRVGWRRDRLRKDGKEKTEGTSGTEEEEKKSRMELTERHVIETDAMSTEKSPNTDEMDAVTDEHVQKEDTEQEEPEVTDGNTREKHPSGTGSEEGEEGPSDESAPLLPRRTKVLVTGNNRTKSSLVGLEGYVKKAVGLGGWHWLVRDDWVDGTRPPHPDAAPIVNRGRSTIVVGA